jgi:hypothetical protein
MTDFCNYKEPMWYNFWGEIKIHISDIFVSHLLGALLYLAIEAPSSEIVKIILKK